MAELIICPDWAVVDNHIWDFCNLDGFGGGDQYILSYVWFGWWIFNHNCNVQVVVDTEAELDKLITEWDATTLQVFLRFFIRSKHLSRLT